MVHDSSATPQDFRSALADRGAEHWWLAGMREITLAVLGTQHGRLLDSGCGPGWLLREFGPGVEVVGLDRFAQRFVAGPVVLGDAGKLPFPDASFDAALALDLLEQSAVQADAAVLEMRRVLRPGGRLLLRVPAHPLLFGPHDRYYGGGRRYRKREVRALVAGSGFQIRRLTYANSLLFPLGATATRPRATGTGRGRRYETPCATPEPSAPQDALVGNELAPAPRPAGRALSDVPGSEVA